VQGDEPAIPAALINQVAKLLLDDASARVGTACHAIRCSREFNDPNVVKVVRDRRGRALYFSRAPIPYTRDIGTGGPKGCRHIGIYSFRAGFLEEFTRWPMTELEQAERLEQLRILEHGVPIEVCDAVEPPGQGIDTPEDLERFSTWVSQNG
jgi:3-deoxy-manno-octulosonate cytidylyltransferase (CMP-KDO synthetase)